MAGRGPSGESRHGGGELDLHDLFSAGGVQAGDVLRDLLGLVSVASLSRSQSLGLGLPVADHRRRETRDRHSLAETAQTHRCGGGDRFKIFRLIWTTAARADQAGNCCTSSLRVGGEAKGTNGGTTGGR